MAEDPIETKTPAKRKGNPAWVKGGPSPNAGGRAKENADFLARARAAVDEHVLEAWISEVKERGPGWVKCSELLAAYGYKRPAAATEDNDALRESGNRLPAGLTAEQVLSIARGERPG